MDDESLNEKNKYPSLINKRLLIVSKYPENANFDIAYDQFAAFKKLLILNAGNSKVSVFLEKDSFQPNELLKVNLDIDNTGCSRTLNSIKVKLIREVISTAVAGSSFSEKETVMKRSIEGCEQNSHVKRQVEFPLEQISFKANKLLNDLAAKKPQLRSELKDWMFSLQPSAKTMSIECKYYIKASFEYSGLNFGNSMNPIYVPITIFHYIQPQQQF